MKNSRALSQAQDDNEIFDVMEPPPANFDLYQDRPRPTGHRKVRADVHRDGDWHRSAHVWLVDPTRRLVLLQQRSMDKDTFPGRWDISAAGHVEAGTGDSKDTAERELAEELGVTLSAVGTSGRLAFGFTCPAEQASLGGCNCYEDVYFLAANSSTCEFAIGGAEVSAIRWMDVQKLKEALFCQNADYVPRVECYLEAFFNHLQKLLENRE